MFHKEIPSNPIIVKIRILSSTKYINMFAQCCNIVKYPTACDLVVQLIHKPLRSVHKTKKYKSGVKYWKYTDQKYCTYDMKNVSHICIYSTVKEAGGRNNQTHELGDIAMKYHHSFGDLC